MTDPREADEPPRRSIWDEDEDASAEEAAFWSAARLVQPAAAPTDPPERIEQALEAEAWLAAEARCGRALADAAAAYARLDERLRAISARRAAAVERLALDAACDLMWRDGRRIAPDLLALWGLDRAGATAEDAQSFARAAWATRRLTSATPRLTDPDAARAFLDDGESIEIDARDETAAIFSDRPTRFERDALIGEWSARLGDLQSAHPFTRAAWARRAFMALGIGEGALEASVAAMSLAARDTMGGAPFAPLSRATRATGPEVEAQLRAHLGRIETGAREALGVVERLIAWEARAREATAHLSGRTPPRLIDALARRFVVSSNAGAARADVSVSAAIRNFATLERLGVAREVTGRGRFRVWSARL